jgi:hypothetical protein
MVAAAHTLSLSLPRGFVPLPNAVLLDARLSRGARLTFAALKRKERPTATISPLISAHKPSPRKGEAAFLNRNQCRFQNRSLCRTKEKKRKKRESGVSTFR